MAQKATTIKKKKKQKKENLWKKTSKSFGKNCQDIGEFEIENEKGHNQGKSGMDRDQRKTEDRWDTLQL